MDNRHISRCVDLLIAHHGHNAEIVAREFVDRHVKLYEDDRALFWHRVATGIAKLLGAVCLVIINGGLGDFVS